jgi:hypothetical protein
MTKVAQGRRVPAPLPSSRESTVQLAPDYKDKNLRTHVKACGAYGLISDIILQQGRRVALLYDVRMRVYGALLQRAHRKVALLLCGHNRASTVQLQLMSGNTTCPLQTRCTLIVVPSLCCYSLASSVILLRTLHLAAP